MGYVLFIRSSNESRVFLFARSCLNSASHERAMSVAHEVFIGMVLYEQEILFY